jgi:hypothetical protein
MNYIYKQNGSIVLFVNQKVHTIDKSALNYHSVLDALDNENWDEVKSLLDVRKYCAEYTNGRVSIAGNDIYLDNVIVRNGLARRMVTLFKDNMNIDPMCRFLENLSKNPLKSAVEELYEFMESNDLPITSDGHFLAYKKVNHNYLDLYSGTIRNKIGDVVTMDRDDVNPNREQTCSTGLHFASYNYASTFGNGHLMVLKINPMDVVSIPNDYNNSKGRCCKYVVVDEVQDDSLDKHYTDQHGFDNDDWMVKDDIDNLDDEPLSDDIHPRTQKAWDAGSKLTEDDVRDIRNDCKSGMYTLKEIAEEYDISARQVGRIRDYEAWSWVTD